MLSAELMTVKLFKIHRGTTLCILKIIIIINKMTNEHLYAGTLEINVKNQKKKKNQMIMPWLRVQY